MTLFTLAPEPKSHLGLHRTLSPTAAAMVSSILLGGISIGSSWSGTIGKNEDSKDLLNTFFNLDGNFNDTSNTYNSEHSARLIGRWMGKRNVRDQMLMVTKHSSGYKMYDRENIPMQTTNTCNSAKSIHVSVQDSLKKPRTDWIDRLYVHWREHSRGPREVAWC
jgi:aryl-alcohol dehydrogenase-like predicted oxidoreductase